MLEKTSQSKTHKQIWIRNDVRAKVESLKLRDESNSSIINFLYEFYIDHKELYNLSEIIDSKKVLKE